jgi:hypothetical protein
MKQATSMVDSRIRQMMEGPAYSRVRVSKRVLTVYKIGVLPEYHVTVDCSKFEFQGSD